MKKSFLTIIKIMVLYFGFREFSFFISSPLVMWMRIDAISNPIILYNLCKIFAVIGVLVLLYTEHKQKKMFENVNSQNILKIGGTEKKRSIGRSIADILTLGLVTLITRKYSLDKNYLQELDEKDDWKKQIE